MSANTSTEEARQPSMVEEGSAQSKRDREERMKVIREKMEQEQQRRLQELRAALEKEERIRRLKEQERLNRIHQLRARDEQRRRGVEERRRAMEQKDMERKENLLARYKEMEAKSSAHTPTKKAIYAFGSSTPRTLAYLDHVDAASRVASAKIQQNGERAASACSLNRKPMSASSSPELVERKAAPKVRRAPPPSTPSSHSNDSAASFPRGTAMTASYAAGESHGAAVATKNVRRKTTVPPASSRSQSTPRPPKAPHPPIERSGRRHDKIAEELGEGEKKEAKRHGEGRTGSQPPPSARKPPPAALKPATLTPTKAKKPAETADAKPVKARAKIECKQEESSSPSPVEDRPSTASSTSSAASTSTASSTATDATVVEAAKATGDEQKKAMSEEEARNALAEKRRLAREEMERQKELERLRQEQLQREEEERVRREEEEQRRQEEEALRLLREQQEEENERMKRAVEEERRRKEEEREKEEEEKRRREEAELKAKEQADRMEKERKEREDRARKEEEERIERRKKLDAIMKRTRQSAGVPQKANGDASPGLRSSSPSDENGSSGLSQSRSEGLMESLSEGLMSKSTEELSHRLSPAPSALSRSTIFDGLSSASSDPPTAESFAEPREARLTPEEAAAAAVMSASASRLATKVKAPVRFTAEDEVNDNEEEPPRDGNSNRSLPGDPNGNSLNVGTTSQDGGDSGVEADHQAKDELITL